MKKSRSRRPREAPPCLHPTRNLNVGTGRPSFRDPVNAHQPEGWEAHPEVMNHPHPSPLPEGEGVKESPRITPRILLVWEAPL